METQTQSLMIPLAAGTTRVEIIDGGATLVCADGTRQPLMRWQTRWLQLGLTSLKQLDGQYNNEPRKA